MKNKKSWRRFITPEALPLLLATACTLPSTPTDAPDMAAAGAPGSGGTRTSEPASAGSGGVPDDARGGAGPRAPRSEPRAGAGGSTEAEGGSGGSAGAATAGAGGSDDPPTAGGAGSGGSNDPGMTGGAGGSPPRRLTALRGVNLAGAEFGVEVPGVYGADYVYPTEAEVDYFVEKGMNVFRLPFRWERLEPVLGAEFEPEEQARLQKFVSYATAQGASVILDPHNYARYDDALIGTASGPSVAEFAGFWGRLAALFANDPQVIFGLMNEPYEIHASDWLVIANAAIGAIRSAGASNVVFVPGVFWSGASTWTIDLGFGVNGDVMLGVIDPEDNVVFEVHQYLNAQGDGSRGDCVNAVIGSQRVAAFTAWLRTHHQRGFLGEFGGGANATCEHALDDLLSHLESNDDVWEGWTYWAAGPWWGDYHFSVEPAEDGTDRPQMAVLAEHL